MRRQPENLACTSDPDLFLETKLELVEIAKGLCRKCVDLEGCLEDGFLPQNLVPGAGVLGGMTADERIALRRHPKQGLLKK